jgi:hypothetical protein
MGPVDPVHGTIDQAIDALPGAVREASGNLLAKQDHLFFGFADEPFVEGEELEHLQWKAAGLAAIG